MDSPLTSQSPSKMTIDELKEPAIEQSHTQRQQKAISQNKYTSKNKQKNSAISSLKSSLINNTKNPSKFPEKGSKKTPCQNKPKITEQKHLSKSQGTTKRIIKSKNVPEIPSKTIDKIPTKSCKTTTYASPQAPRPKKKNTKESPVEKYSRLAKIKQDAKNIPKSSYERPTKAYILRNKLSQFINKIPTNNTMDTKISNIQDAFKNTQNNENEVYQIISPLSPSLKGEEILTPENQTRIFFIFIYF